MKSIPEYIKSLQDKPEHIKQRILFGTSAAAAIVVVAIWFTGFKNQLRNIDGGDLINIASTSTTQQSAQHYVKIENAEDKDNQTYIYFSINNDSGDILNVSTFTDISLTVGGKKYTPVKLTDRQGNQFIKKALSNSQNFGILVFDKLPKTNATITFDNMYFEQSQGTVFKETADTDLSKLTPLETIRN